jgi:aminoglycoside phosphotransferase
MNACRAACLLLLIPLVAGCQRSDRTELQRTRSELERAKAEIAALQSQLTRQSAEHAATSYLEELEKLSQLLEKKVLTDEEFLSRKQAILEGQKLSPVAAPGSTSTMDSLAQQLRDLHALYNSTTISLQQHNAKKAQLIAQPLTRIEMKKDLETVKTLYNASMITVQEQETLKQKILQLDAEGHGHG